jgi:hypothetical protein
MLYINKLRAMRHYVAENFLVPEDAVTWLGLTLEDIIKAFPEALVGKYEEIEDELPEEDRQDYSTVGEDGEDLEEDY